MPRRNAHLGIAACGGAGAAYLLAKEAGSSD